MLSSNFKAYITNITNQTRACFHLSLSLTHTHTIILMSITIKSSQIIESWFMFCCCISFFRAADSITEQTNTYQSSINSDQSNFFPFNVNNKIKIMIAIIIIIIIIIMHYTSIYARKSFLLVHWSFLSSYFFLFLLSPFEAVPIVPLQPLVAFVDVNFIRSIVYIYINIYLYILYLSSESDLRHC